eukprot:1195667-Prorocentrum_minimum.AAC.14
MYSLRRAEWSSHPLGSPGIDSPFTPDAPRTGVRFDNPLSEEGGDRTAQRHSDEVDRDNEPDNRLQSPRMYGEEE